MDITTIGGIVLAIGGILLGQHLEGGHASSILQATAFIIVMCGTIGARRSTALSSTSCTTARSAAERGSKRPSSFNSSITAAMAVLNV